MPANGYQSRESIKSTREKQFTSNVENQSRDVLKIERAEARNSCTVQNHSPTGMVRKVRGSITRTAGRAVRMQEGTGETRGGWRRHAFERHRNRAPRPALTQEEAESECGVSGFSASTPLTFGAR